jgi:hypothetical protein
MTGASEDRHLIIHQIFHRAVAIILPFTLVLVILKKELFGIGDVMDLQAKKEKFY